MTISAIWHDGHQVRGPDWGALERKMREDQWHTYGALGFRVEMRRRAKLWSGAPVRVLGTSRRFLTDLERAGLLRLEVSSS